MQATLRKRLLWTTLAGAGLISAAFGWLAVNQRLDAMPPGYCVAQQRYIPDQEFIQTAVALYEWDMNRDRKDLQSGKISKKKIDRAIEYRMWQRSRSGPGCCFVNRAGTESAISRMRGSQQVEVVLMTNQDSKGDSQVRFAFGVCGDLLPHEFGFHLPSTLAVSTRNYQTLIHPNN